MFQVVREAVGAGVDGYDYFMKQSVKKAAYGLRLSREVAMSIAGKAVSIHSPPPLVYFFFLSFFFAGVGVGSCLVQFIYNILPSFLKFKQVNVGKLCWH